MDQKRGEREDGKRAVPGERPAWARRVAGSRVLVPSQGCGRLVLGLHPATWCLPRPEA